MPLLVPGVQLSYARLHPLCPFLCNFCLSLPTFWSSAECAVPSLLAAPPCLSSICFCSSSSPLSVPSLPPSILMGSGQVRLVTFQVPSVGVYGLLGGGVQVLNHDCASRQHGTSIGQDGKCLRQDVERHGRTVSRWVEPWSGWRVLEGL